jgi:hypothetical protein
MSMNFARLTFMTCARPSFTIFVHARPYKSCRNEFCGRFNARVTDAVEFLEDLSSEVRRDVRSMFAGGDIAVERFFCSKKRRLFELKSCTFST